MIGDEEAEDEEKVPNESCWPGRAAKTDGAAEPALPAT